jgi:hypothetical protein
MEIIEKIYYRLVAAIAGPDNCCGLGRTSSKILGVFYEYWRRVSNGLRQMLQSENQN